MAEGLQHNNIQIYKKFQKEKLFLSFFTHYYPNFVEKGLKITHPVHKRGCYDYWD